MLQSLYPLFLGGILLGIVGWFYAVFRNPDARTPWSSLLFWGSSLFYAVSLYFSDFSFWYKILLMLPRDIGTMLVVFLIANNLKSSRGFFMLLLTMGISLYMLFSGIGMKVYTYFNTPEVDTKAEILFEVENEEEMQSIESNLATYDIKVRKAFPDLKNPQFANLQNFYVADVADAESLDLHTISNIMYATGAEVSFNKIVKLSPMETKSHNIKAKGTDYIIDDPELDKLWGFDLMKMNDFYQYLKENNIKPKKKVKIAILDTGVDSKHEDIEGKFVSTRSEYDSDKQSHGTHCAGIAASVSDNGKGIASFSPNDAFVEVTSIKVLNDNGTGTDLQILQGITEASDNGVDIISMSLGGPSMFGRQDAYEKAIAYAQKSGAIVIVAAGNESQDAREVTPANVKGVITVSAVDNNLNLADFSNYVSGIEMAVAAPGVEIYSTIPNDKYAAYSGTSMATPYVAGLVAMLKSINPDLTTEEVYEILTSTGLDTKDTENTGKFIQPLEAMKKVVN